MKVKDSIQVVGSVQILRVLDRDGKPVPTERVLVAGTRDLGPNLVVDAGREVLARLLGGATTGYQVSRVSVGTGDDPPRYNDVTLSPQPGGEYVGGENQVELYAGATDKAIEEITFPAPFLVQFRFALDYGEANGFVIREAGLWTDSGVLFARKSFPGIIKGEENRIEMAWTIRT